MYFHLIFFYFFQFECMCMSFLLRAEIGSFACRFMDSSKVICPVGINNSSYPVMGYV